MANIELVIKIPEEDYKFLREAEGCRFSKTIIDGVINGIPLPKGHGDLKDMGNLQYVFDLTREDSIYSGKDIERAIKSMKSIIEADSEVEK